MREIALRKPNLRFRIVKRTLWNLRMVVFALVKLSIRTRKAILFGLQRNPLRPVNEPFRSAKGFLLHLNRASFWMTKNYRADLQEFVRIGCFAVFLGQTIGEWKYCSLVRVAVKIFYQHSFVVLLPFAGRLCEANKLALTSFQDSPYKKSCHVWLYIQTKKTKQ